MSTQVHGPHVDITLAWWQHSDISPMSRLVSVVGLLSGRCQIWSAFDRTAVRSLPVLIGSWCQIWSAFDRTAVRSLPVLIGHWSTVSRQLDIGPLSECRSARCRVDVWFECHVVRFRHIPRLAGGSMSGLIVSSAFGRHAVIGPLKTQQEFRDRSDIGCHYLVDVFCGPLPSPGRDRDDIDKLAAITGPISGRYRQNSWVIFSFLAQRPHGSFVLSTNESLQMGNVSILTLVCH